MTLTLFLLQTTSPISSFSRAAQSLRNPSLPMIPIRLHCPTQTHHPNNLKINPGTPPTDSPSNLTNGLDPQCYLSASRMILHAVSTSPRNTITMTAEFHI